MSIPVNSGSSFSPNNTDLFVTLQAPSSMGWFAIGFGSRMSGSLMMVAWPNNNEAVASLRLGTGHSLPSVYSGATLEVLATNVTSQTTTVQLNCSGCTEWSNGNLDIESTSAEFIWAYSSSEPSNPSDSSSSFSQHDDYGGFTLDLTSAQLSTNTTGSTPQTTGQPTVGVAGPVLPTIDPTKVNAANSGDNGLTRKQIIIFHGVFMGLVWVILFPLGAIIIRFLNNSVFAPALKHQIIQIGALIFLLGGGAFGIYLCQGHQFTLFHHTFGAVIIIAAIIQAGFGWYHHKRYVQDKPTHRRWFTYVHLWLGRVLLFCGLLNCGFGLAISEVAYKWAVIWWVFCALLAVIYFGAYIIVARKRSRMKDTADDSADIPLVPTARESRPVLKTNSVSEFRVPDRPPPAHDRRSRYGRGGFDGAPPSRNATYRPDRNHGSGYQI